MKRRLGILILSVFLAIPASPQSHDLTHRLYLWFDLGNVLIETRDGFDRLRWMPGAYEMIFQLKQRGFKIGLISNIPDSWGHPNDPQSKIDKLQEELKKGWIDSDPFDLAIFDDVLLPMRKEEAKPARKLFLDAIHLALSQGKNCLFQGESPQEVLAANDAGMESHLIEFDESGQNPKYFPMDELLDFSLAENL